MKTTVFRDCGSMDNNCYVAEDDGEAIVIDAPEGSAQRVAKRTAKAGVRVTLLVNTHGHFDHTADNAKFKKLFNCKIACHADDAKMLEKPGGREYGIETQPSKADVLLQEGMALAFGNASLTVLHCPGHTPGSACLYWKERNELFSGDVLFHQGRGRTDLPGGDEPEMLRSLARLALLPPSTRVLPGHGEETTIRKENPECAVR